MVKIYKQPFAHDGDTIAIPDASQPDGKISSADGWTPDYQLPKTDPNYKPVGRQEMNGVFKVVTEALGQVQVQGSASWSADGAPYPINAQVYHGSKQWIALRENSVEPTEGDDWTELVGKQYIDADKVSTFDNLATLQASTQVKIGQFVRTLGYYTPGDGGGNDYEIVSAGTGTDDGGSFIDLPGSGAQAKGLFGGQVSFEMFGAVGDGVVDDTVALKNTITFSDGISIVGKNGAKYLQTSGIEYSGNVNISGEFTFYQNGQKFDGLNFSGVDVGSTSLTANMAINNKKWSVADSSFINVGDIVAIKSSLSWYHDPRPDSSDARKSELHRVEKVEVGAFYTELPSNDGYDLSKESVEVFVTRPIAVNLTGFTVEAVHDTPSPSARSRTGLVVYGATDSYISVNSKNYSYTGVRLTRCYSSRVDNGFSVGANLNGTGYGANLLECTLCEVSNYYFYNCRRGVDVSGLGIISMKNVLRDCECVGGGITTDGETWGWNEDGTTGSVNFGFGSHGPSDTLDYINNTVVNVHTPFVQRGRNERFLGNKLMGRHRARTFALNSGTGTVISGTQMDKSWFAGKEMGTLPDNATTRISPENFISIQGEYYTDTYSRLNVHGNDVITGDKVVVIASENVGIGVSFSDNNVLSVGSGVSSEVVFFDMQATGNLIVEKADLSGWVGRSATHVLLPINSGKQLRGRITFPGGVFDTTPTETSGITSVSLTASEYYIENGWVHFVFRGTMNLSSGEFNFKLDPPPFLFSFTSINQVYGHLTSSKGSYNGIAYASTSDQKLYVAGGGATGSNNLYAITGKYKVY